MCVNTRYIPCIYLIFTEDVPLAEFMYLVFTHMPSESYCRWLRSLLLYLLHILKANLTPLCVDSSVKMRLLTVKLHGQNEIAHCQTAWWLLLLNPTTYFCWALPIDISSDKRALPIDISSDKHSPFHSSMGLSNKSNFLGKFCVDSDLVRMQQVRARSCASCKGDNRGISEHGRIQLFLGVI